MAESLRSTVKRLLLASDLTYQKISDRSGVPYGALYYFATKGEDMKSEHMEKLYEFFTGEKLIVDES